METQNGKFRKLDLNEELNRRNRSYNGTLKSCENTKQKTRLFKESIDPAFA